MLSDKATFTLAFACLFGMLGAYALHLVRLSRRLGVRETAPSTSQKREPGKGGAP
ncbi:MAG: hypothetical protein ACYDBQ_01440 [Thermoplasmatota archaeon]